MQVCKVARVLDPSFAAQHLVPHDVAELISVVSPLEHHVDLHELEKELPAYLAAAKNIKVDHDDVRTFSDQVLKFWKNTSEKELSHWRKAARIMFCMSPNSASCERVFSMLSFMYGSTRENVLADHLQASIMLRFNNRNVMEH